MKVSRVDSAKINKLNFHSIRHKFEGRDTPLGVAEEQMPKRKLIDAINRRCEPQQIYYTLN